MQSQKRTRILSATLIGGIALCAVTTLFTLGRQVDPNPSLEASGQSLRLHAAERMSYEVCVDTDVRIADGASSRSWHHRLQGRLTVQSASTGESRDDKLRFACQLHDATQDVDGSDCPDPRLAAFFTVDVDESGRFGSFHFPKNLPEAPRGQLEEMMQLFQVVVPMDAGDSWRAEEVSRHGRCDVVYRRAADGLSRCRVRYAPTESRRVSVNASRARFQLATAGIWLQRGTIHEAITVRGAMSQTVTAATDATLRLVSREPASAITVAMQAASMDTAIRRIREVEIEDDRRADQQRTAATAADKQRFRDLLAELDDATKPGPLLDRLRDAMLAHPELCAMLLDMLANEGHADLTASTAIHALCMAGHAAAQKTLLDLADDERMSQRNRVRALIDIGGVKRPTAGAIESLWSFTAQREDAASREMATTATLALGRLGRTMRESGAAGYPQLRDRLQSDLAASRDDEHRVALLTAAGNTGDSNLREPVAARLQAGDVMSRAAAAKALGRIPDSQVPLLRGLSQEQNARVRSRIATGLLRQGELGAAPLNIVARRLATETDETARFAMARVLGKNLAAHEDSRTALQALLRTESSARIRRYVAGQLAQF